MTMDRRNPDYYRGVADALDVVREWEFPFTDLVDHIAERLAPEPDALDEEDGNV